MQIDRETTNRWSHEAQHCLRNSQVDYDMTDVLMFVAQRAAEAALELAAKRFDSLNGTDWLAENVAEELRANIRARGITKEQA